MLATATEDFRRRSGNRRDFPQQGPAFRRGPKAGAEGPCGYVAFDQRSRARTASTGADGGGHRRGEPGPAKGIITQADLDQYKTRELAPVECDYRGYHVVSAPPPSSGGVVICEMLNILEGYPLRELGLGLRAGGALPDRGDAPRLCRSQQLLGDPDFVKNPARTAARQELRGKNPGCDQAGQGRGLQATSSRASRRTKAATRRITRSSTMPATRFR